MNVIAYKNMEKIKCPKGSCAELKGPLCPTNRVYQVLGYAVVGQTQKRLVKVMAKYGGHTCSPSLISQASQAGGDLRVMGSIHLLHKTEHRFDCSSQ